MVHTHSRVLAFKIVLLSAILVFMTSCDNNQKGKDPKEAAEERNEDMEADNKGRDTDFMIRAAEINMEEIQLSKLAQQKGTNADVKNLANILVKHHSKAMSDVSALAGSKSIAIPTATTDKVKNAYDKLNEKAAGNDFDKEYCDMMVKGHKDAIDAFEKASSNAHDADIKAWAATMLPQLRNHLDQAMACDEKLKKM